MNEDIARTRRDEPRKGSTARAIMRARQGDPEALRDLYVAHAGEVHRTVRAVLRDEHETEDVSQQLFARLPVALERYRPAEVPFGAWIRRVARNAAIDHLRARRRQVTGSLEAIEGGRVDGGVEPGLSLRTALGELPEDQRRVVIMRHVLGLSPGEIAVALGKSETAVHGLHHRGRRTLRAELTRLGSAPQTRVAA